MDRLTPKPWLCGTTWRVGSGKRRPGASPRSLSRTPPLCEHVLGTEHSGTLSTWHNLAYWTGEAGDPAEARDLFAELVPIHERVLSAEHPDAVTARLNLAYWAERARG